MNEALLQLYKVMNFINKSRTLKPLTTIIALVSITFIILIFQGCKKEEEEPNSSNMEAIMNSNEFEEYITASFELYSVYQNANSMLKDTKFVKMMKVGITSDGITYKTFPFKIDQNLLKNVSNTREALLKKYPSFKYYSNENKKYLVNNTLMSSRKLNDYLYKKGIDLENHQLVRLKSDCVEGPGTYTYTNPTAAFTDAMDWSADFDKECSGYVFSDGSCVLFINGNATHSGTSYPGCPETGTQATTYNGKVIESTFHTHFNGSTYSDPETNPTGPNDLSVQEAMFPHANIIILYQNQAYVYQAPANGWGGQP